MSLKNGPAAPCDTAPHLYKPPKPKVPKDVLRPVRPPGTAWKSSHVRFDNAKRDWTVVQGHWSKKPGGPHPTLADELLVPDRQEASLLLRDAADIVLSLFDSVATPSADGESEHRDDSSRRDTISHLESKK